MGLFRRNEERAQLLSFYRPWYRRPSIWLALMLPTLVLLRLAATPLAWYQVRSQLEKLPDYDVSFSSMSLAMLGKRVVFRNVKVFHRADGNRADSHALASIPFVEVDVPMLRLLRGGPVDQVLLIDPTFRLRPDAQLAPSVDSKQAWMTAFRRLPLQQIGNVRIQRGTVLAADQTMGGADRPLVRDLDAAITGLAIHGAHTNVQAKINGGVLLGSGILKADASFTPDGQRSWDFAGNLFVAGLDLQDIQAHALAPAAATSPPPQGKFRIKASFEGKRGQLVATIETEVAKDAAVGFSEDVLAALTAKTTRNTGMTVWLEGNRMQAALPATMVPLRFAAIVPTIVLQAAAQVCKPAPPPPVATDLTAGVPAPEQP